MARLCAPPYSIVNRVILSAPSTSCKQGLFILYVWSLVTIRETREGWPLLAVETDETEMNELFLGWFVGRVVQVQEIFFLALAALVGPVQNIFSRTVHNFNSFIPIACSKLGRQSCWATMSLSMCLWSQYIASLSLPSPAGLDKQRSRDMQSQVGQY